MQLRGLGILTAKLMVVSIGSEKFSKCAAAVDQIRELGSSQPTVYRWRKGDALPPEAKRLKIFELYGIKPEEWFIGVGGEVENPRAPGAPEPEVVVGDPSPRALWEDTHKWRKRLEKQKAPAREIAAALTSEREALKLLAGDATKYAELQRVTAKALVLFPEALAALQEAWAEAGL